MTGWSGRVSAIPFARAASSVASNWIRAMVSSHRTATFARPGTPSFRSWSSFPAISGWSRKRPVRLPPGRAMLAIHPLTTGSVSQSSATTMGAARVASRTARVAYGLDVTMAADGRPASSRARAGNPSSFPCAYRISTRTSCPRA